jgi:hypothetical protein
MRSRKNNSPRGPKWKLQNGKVFIDNSEQEAKDRAIEQEKKHNEKLLEEFSRKDPFLRIPVPLLKKLQVHDKNVVYGEKGLAGIKKPAGIDAKKKKK